MSPVRCDRCHQSLTNTFFFLIKKKVKGLKTREPDVTGDSILDRADLGQVLPEVHTRQRGFFHYYYILKKLHTVVSTCSYCSFG